MTHILAAALALAQEHDGEQQGQLHPFIAEALASPHAIRSNFFMGTEGRIVRSSVCLRKEGVPDWVHEAADRKLGKGEDVLYEAEVYPDGSQVYEVYRKVGGREKQLSVRLDGTLFYVGKEMDPTDLPASVACAVAELADFEAKRCVSKEGPAFHEYHVKGTRNGIEFRARLDKEGRLIALQRGLPATLEVEQAPSGGP